MLGSPIPLELWLPVMGVSRNLGKLRLPLMRGSGELRPRMGFPAELRFQWKLQLRVVQAGVGKMPVPFLGSRGLGRSRGREGSRKLGEFQELGRLREPGGPRELRELRELTVPLMRCPMKLEGLIAPLMECPTELEVRRQLCLPQVGVTGRLGKRRHPLVERLPALLERQRAVERLPDLLELPRAVERLLDLLERPRVVERWPDLLERPRAVERWLDLLERSRAVERWPDLLERLRAVERLPALLERPRAVERWPDPLALARAVEWWPALLQLARAVGCPTELVVLQQPRFPQAAVSRRMEFGNPLVKEVLQRK